MGSFPLPFFVAGFRIYGYSDKCINKNVNRREFNINSDRWKATLVKFKNNIRKKIFIIISVIVLIVLVWCVALTNIEASEHGTKPGELLADENSINKEESLESEKRENIKNVEEENVESPKEENIKNVEKDNIENPKEGNIEVIKKDNLEDNDKSKETLEKENLVVEEEEKESEDIESGDDSNSVENDTTSDESITAPEETSEGDVYVVYNNTLIIGDSRIEGFKLYAGVKNAVYFCRKAMTIDEIVAGKQLPIEGQNISVYDLLDETSYDKIIIGVGLNELGWNHIETFLEDYAQLIDKIKEKQPTSSIYLQAILPVSKLKNENDKVHNNAQIYWYNENIINLASDKGVEFVNPAAALVGEDGCLLAEATTDGVHLNSEYCKVWAKYLARLV